MAEIDGGGDGSGDGTTISSSSPFSVLPGGIVDSISIVKNSSDNLEIGFHPLLWNTQTTSVGTGRLNILPDGVVADLEGGESGSVETYIKTSGFTYDTSSTGSFTVQLDDSEYSFSNSQYAFLEMVLSSGGSDDGGAGPTRVEWAIRGDEKIHAEMYDGSNQIENTSSLTNISSITDIVKAKCEWNGTDKITMTVEDSNGNQDSVSVTESGIYPSITKPFNFIAADRHGSNSLDVRGKLTRVEW